MKFKILKSAAIFQQLVDLNIASMNMKQKKFNKALEAGGIESGLSNKLHSSIHAIHFFSNIKNYPFIEHKYKLCYRALLPVLWNEELNKNFVFNGINYGAIKDIGLRNIKYIEIHFGEEVILINIQESFVYTPLNGIIEISDSQFEELTNELNKKGEIDYNLFRKKLSEYKTLNEYMAACLNNKNNKVIETDRHKVALSAKLFTIENPVEPSACVTCQNAFIKGYELCERVISEETGLIFTSKKTTNE